MTLFMSAQPFHKSVTHATKQEKGKQIYLVSIGERRDVEAGHGSTGRCIYFWSSLYRRHSLFCSITHCVEKIYPELVLMDVRHSLFRSKI
jgi:hypothetical protein